MSLSGNRGLHKGANQPCKAEFGSPTGRALIVLLPGTDPVNLSGGGSRRGPDKAGVVTDPAKLQPQNVAVLARASAISAVTSTAVFQGQYC